MSRSPSSNESNDIAATNKRRRTHSVSTEGTMLTQSPQESTHQPLPAQGNPLPPPGHIPKRGARACTACRKGKNRCEGEAPCRRCQLSGTSCVFEKPEKKPPQPPANVSLERVTRLENQCLFMQSQLLGFQSSLDRILAAIQNGVPPVPGPSNAYASAPGPYSAAANMHAGRGRDMPTNYVPGGSRGNVDLFSADDTNGMVHKKTFPPLPGFAAPPHKYATYGIVPSTAASSDDESEDTLPRSSMNAPIEALQGLANAAAEAAAAPSSLPPRVKKRKRAEPTPRNAFPHVVEKGLVTDAEARELFHIFFSGCHLFIPLFDETYDTYEGLRERSPWTFDAILAIASKIRSGNSPLSATFYKCLEEAQGIARSSLFGPVVRKEAVQGMLLLAAWSTNGWLPSGHAMRMALDLGLHRALEKLANGDGKRRSEEEERDLVVSARIWLCLYWFDHQMSLGTGRPIVLRDENTIRNCRVLLTHPMASPTDVRLISQIDLIAQKTQIYETLSPLNGQVNHNTLAYIRRANASLDKWWRDCDDLHARTLDEDSLLRKMLIGELHYAKLWLVCVALRGISWDKMPFEQRELAFQAKDAAMNCLAIFLNSHSYRAALRYAVHDSLVTAAFSALFLLKMAHLFPTEVELPVITAQVEQLAQLLSDVAAERYALTLRIMLANLRRKMGPAIINNAPAAQQQQMPLPQGAEHILVPPSYIDPTAVPAPITMEELGFAWPAERGIFRPSAIPLWLQEASLTDLGIPVNGSDDIFLQLSGPGGWAGDFAPMPQAW